MPDDWSRASFGQERKDTEVNCTDGGMRLRGASRLLVLCIPLVCTAVLAGCGSSSSSSSSASSNSGSSTAKSSSIVAKAKAIVATAMHVSTAWPGPNTPVKPPAQKGKLGVVTCGPYGGCLQNGEGAAAGAKAVGWTSTMVNPTTGSPEEVNGDIEKLINGGATAIIWGGWPSSILGPAIAAAKRAHIPTASIEAGETTPTDINEGAQGKPFLQLGALVGWWMIANSNGKAQVGVLSDNEYTTGQDIDKGLERVIAQCPGCKIVASQDIPAAQEQTLAPTDTVAMLRSNPSINYMFVPFDSRVPYVVEGVRQAGKPNVQIASEQPGSSSIKALTAPQPTLDAATQSSEIWAGWAAFDQLLREIAHQPLVYHPLPLILTTRANAKVPTYIPLSTTNAIDFPAHFKKLWGVGS